MPQLKGIIAPVTTPFDPTGQLQISAFGRNLEKYCDTPLTGLLVGGTTGEGPHLESDERIELVRIAAETVRKGMDLLVGLPGWSGYQGLRELNRLAQFPITAVLASVPVCYPPAMTPSALGRYFSSLADESPFPILLYNIPKMTGIELPVSLVKELARHPRIAGMKESSGNMIYVQHVLDSTRGEVFELISGSGETFGLARDLGVRSGILAVACALPHLAAGAVDPEMADRGRVDRELFQAAATIVGAGVPGVKRAMDLSGYEGLHCRLPLGPLDEAASQRVEQALLQARRYLAETQDTTAL